MPSGRPPSTLSTTTLSGQGFASSRSPISSTWTTATANAQRYGRSRRRTFPTTRSVPPTRCRPAQAASAAAAACRRRPGASPSPAADDVEGVVQDARRAGRSPTRSPPRLTSPSAVPTPVTSGMPKMTPSATEPAKKPRLSCDTRVRRISERTLQQPLRCRRGSPPRP